MAEPRTPTARLRLDKWLWAARFYKTRHLAAQAIDAGHVRLGDDRVKIAHAVTLGARISIRKAGLVWSIEVTGLADKRGSATDAALLYRESEESVAARTLELARRAAAAASMPLFSGRPTKRDRRKLQDFLDEA